MLRENSIIIAFGYIEEAEVSYREGWERLILEESQ